MEGDERPRSSRANIERDRGSWEPVGRRRWPILLVAILALGVSACSFAVVRPTPRRASPEGALACRSRLLPTGDLLVLTPALGFLGLIAVWATYEMPPPGEPRRTGREIARLVGFELGAIASLASSIYGYAALSKCHARRRAALRVQP